MKITIITATFNRRQSLERLYHSILDQDYKAVEWIVVDNGSTDDTRAAVESLQKESPFEIQYLLELARGKPPAVNRGLDHVTGDIISIIDDDDYLLPQVLGRVASDYERIRDDTSMVGLSYLTVDPGGKTWGRSFSSDGLISDHYRCRINDQIWGDKLEFTTASLVRDHHIRFFAPDVPGGLGGDTRFFLDIAAYGNTQYFNLPILVKDYQPDGTSFNWRKRTLECPPLTQRYYVSHVDPRVRFRLRLRYMIAAIALARFTSDPAISALIPVASNRFTYALAYIPGVLVGMRWRSYRDGTYPVSTRWLAGK